MALECLDESTHCRGEVRYRDALTETGVRYPRCDAHWEKRLAKQRRIDEDYGYSNPPAWFDPSYAGERWDDDY